MPIKKIFFHIIWQTDSKIYAVKCQGRWGLITRYVEPYCKAKVIKTAWDLSGDRQIDQGSRMETTEISSHI